MIKKEPSAFASIMAIALIGLTGVVLAAVAAMLHYQFQRTQRTASDTQLRQLLLAGGLVARNMDPDKPAPTVPLPQQLVTDGGKVAISVAKTGGDQFSAIIEASLLDRRMSQTMRFVRSEGGWKLAQVELE